MSDEILNNAISSDFKISKSQTDPSYQANYKIIELLIAEKKFSKNLEKFYYQKHKEAITMAINNSLNEEALKYRQLVISYLTFGKKTLKLFRFKLGVIFFKIIPIDNFFLVYRDTPLTRFSSKEIEGGFIKPSL